jgi:hypothetical protein
MAMARAYLEEIGAGAQMTDDPGVPFAVQLRSENCIGEIGRRDVVHHEFRAARDRLRSVQLCFATYGNPRNRRPVRMRLENAAGATLARGEIPATAIEDNRWVGATLSPCPLDVGSTYRLEISAPVPLLGGGSITLRCSSQAQRDGAFAINGTRREGALAIALF